MNKEKKKLGARKPRGAEGGQKAKKGQGRKSVGENIGDRSSFGCLNHCRDRRRSKIDKKKGGDIRGKGTPDLNTKSFTSSRKRLQIRKEQKERKKGRKKGPQKWCGDIWSLSPLWEGGKKKEKQGGGVRTFGKSRPTETLTLRNK